MRLTFVVHQFPPHFFTGTEQYALAVARELIARGHDVDVFTLDPRHHEADRLWRESRESVDGVPVRRLTFWWQLGKDWARMEYRHPLMAAVFARHLQERSPDVVHTFHLRHVGADLIDEVVAQRRGLVVSLTDFWFLCPRAILMRGDGAPCEGPPEGGRGCLPCHQPEVARMLADHPAAPELLALHATAASHSRPGWEPFHRTGALLDRPRYLRERLLRAHAIVAPTRFLADVFVRNGIPADRLACQGYGIDTHGIAAGAAAARPAGARPPTFGFFGTFAPHKAPHLLVEALAQVRGDCRVVLRGRAADFPDYSGPLLAAAARDPRITVLPPFARAELPAAFAGIDALVVPSTWHENAPFVVLEARAAGLPVLASRFGGLVEVVRDDVDGELFSAGDVPDLAACLQRLVDDPTRLRRYRDAVRPPKTLAEAVDEFETHYRGAAAR
ncbi:MAG: glycosyltransferase [Planctomycetes bacterium]|nr:glycosyltransferase [Planctomycetota bacterium]